MSVLNIVKDNPVVELAAEYLFRTGKGDHGDEENPKEFKDLSSTAKLALVTDHQKQVIVDLANSFKSTEAQTVARELEEASKHTI